jgi:hypothetical protein
MLFYFTFGCISEDIIHDGTLVGNAGSSKGKLAENAFFVYGSSADENDNELFIQMIVAFDQSNNVLYEIHPNVDFLSQDIQIPVDDIYHLQFHSKKTQIRYYHQTMLKEELLEIPESEINFYLQKKWEDKNYIFEFGEHDWLNAENPIQNFLYSSSIFEDINGDGIIDENERANPLQNEQVVEIDGENLDQEETSEQQSEEQNNSNPNASEQGDNSQDGASNSNGNSEHNQNSQSDSEDTGNVEDTGFEDDNEEE